MNRRGQVLVKEARSTVADDDVAIGEWASPMIRLSSAALAGNEYGTGAERVRYGFRTEHPQQVWVLLAQPSQLGRLAVPLDHALSRFSDFELKHQGHGNTPRSVSNRLRSRSQPMSATRRTDGGAD
jgi:hypothetical protein